MQLELNLLAIFEGIRLSRMRNYFDGLCFNASRLKRKRHSWGRRFDPVQLYQL